MFANCLNKTRRIFLHPASVSFIVLTSVTRIAYANVVINPDQPPTLAEIKAVNSAVPSYMKKEKFTVGLARIQKNKPPAIIVHYTGSIWCGSGGCAAIALLRKNNGYSHKPINLPNFTQSVTVLPRSHDGMHDLIFDNSNNIFRWNGHEYK